MNVGPHTCRMLITIGTLLIVSNSLDAQSWIIDSYAGRANYNIAPISVASKTGVVGIHYNHNQRFFDSSVGVPFSNNDVTWGVASLGERLAIWRRAMRIGVDTAMLA